MVSWKLIYFKIIVYLCFHPFPCHSDVHYVNWSLATERGHSHKEREYSHPAYNEVALSPCDLTEDSCDIGCCSDQDCSLEQRGSFDCIGGLEDGEKMEGLSYLNCNHESEIPHEAWFNVLCYVATNTPYLGEYFVTQKKIELISKFTDAATQKKENFEFPGLSESRSSDLFEAYKFGSAIKMVLNSDDTMTSRPKFLEMPSNIFSDSGGLCIDDTPVRYLLNRKSSCMRTISKNVCEKGAHSPLSVYRYMVAEFSSNDSVTDSQFLYVAKNGKGQNSTISELRFLCFNNGSDYITFSKNVFSYNISKLLSSKQFHDENPLFECMLSPEELLYPSFDESEEVCRNVLISVNYDFTWNGVQIEKLTATYIITDIPVTVSAFIKMKTDISDINNSVMKTYIKHNDKNSAWNKKVKLYVTQKFESTFNHYKVDDSLDSNDTYVEDDVVTYSGNPGYEIGHPLIALSSYGNETEWEESIIAVWENVAGCEQMKPLEFGYDMITTCRLEIDIEDFEDCNNIRSRVLQLQQKLVPGDVVSQGGIFRRSGLNITTFGELVPILREPLINKSGGGEEGICSGVPARHVVDILYTTMAEPGPKGSPIHRICGVRVSLENVDWIPTEEESRQTFLLESVVTYTFLPIMDQQLESRFWEKVKSPEGSENAWFRIFQIIEEFETGDEIFEMSACVILLGATAVALVLFLKHEI